MKPRFRIIASIRTPFVNLKPSRLLALRPVRWIGISLCALLAAGTVQSLSAKEGDASGGHLSIRRSPLLGFNLIVSITIDGKPMGSLTRGRTLETNLTPGTHTIAASPGNGENPWRATLNVRPGETYTYSASYGVNQLVLTRLSH